ncbi:lipopolysaccharide biosynthesis protein [Pseudorhodoferax sp.]|uniref:lipopolysaccharide biosynthesis protein n=1 Tax=Pseudorhodoferax sp. TaxID=1993553 RepID=UPI002DD695D5|nr:oligosaccharide flippase family protein [Pseudorhodoferax sp.]
MPFQRLRSKAAAAPGGARSRDVFRNMRVLATGSGLAKLVALLLTPVVARIYSPEAFGSFAIFLAATTMATPFTSLRYSAALPLPRRDDTAVNLLACCLALLLACCLLLALVLALASAPLFEAFGAGALAPFWPLFVLSVALAGGYEILTSWSVRARSFRRIAKAEITMSMVGGLCKIALAFAALARLGLVLGHLLGQACSVALLLRGAVADMARHRRRIGRRHMLRVLVRYADFPRYRFASQILLLLSAQLPIFLVGAQYGAAVAGQLGLAFTVMAIPVTLLVQTTAQAYYAEIARIGRNDPAGIAQLSRSIAKKLLLLGIAPTLVLVFGSPVLFRLLFGPQWGQAGVFSSALAIYLLAQFVSNPLSNVLNVLHRQRLNLVLDAVRAFVSALVLLAGAALDWPATQTVYAFAIGLALYYCLHLFCVFSCLSAEVRKKKSVPERPAHGNEPPGGLV